MKRQQYWSEQGQEKGGQKITRDNGIVGESNKVTKVKCCLLILWVFLAKRNITSGQESVQYFGSCADRRWELQEQSERVSLILGEMGVPRRKGHCSWRRGEALCEGHFLPFSVGE